MYYDCYTASCVSCLHINTSKTYITYIMTTSFSTFPSLPRNLVEKRSSTLSPPVSHHRKRKMSNPDSASMSWWYLRADPAEWPSYLRVSTHKLGWKSQELSQPWIGWDDTSWYIRLEICKHVGVFAEKNSEIGGNTFFQWHGWYSFPKKDRWFTLNHYLEVQNG